MTSYKLIRVCKNDQNQQNQLKEQLDNIELSLNIVDLQHPLGKRINIVGGGGKTTLARALSDRYGYQNIELDALHFLPHWVERSAEDFQRQVDLSIKNAGDSWVIDGNYFEKLECLSSNIDMFIWIDLPWRVMFRRTFVRSLKRMIDRTKICGDNFESWSKFFSTDSLWWWYMSNYSDIANREEMLSRYIPRNVPVIRLSNTKELDLFYETWIKKVDAKKVSES